MPQFDRYLGIDYSGARTPSSSLPGLRVYSATATQEPAEVRPPPSTKKHWTRGGMADWLASELRAGPTTLVGIDHAFSLPLRYFETHRIPLDWPAFLDDFKRHWPTDGDNIYVDSVRDGRRGNGAARGGNARWRRPAELRCGAKSVFHFDVPGSVAKSTHAGLPWLLHLRRELGQRVHFWPFDGWTPPAGRSVIAEVYPALWGSGYAKGERNSDQHDAYSAARWMRDSDSVGTLGGYFEPALSAPERMAAQVEGWILGVA